MLKVKDKNTSGFSLIETLVAISIGILVAVLIMAVVTPGLKNVRSIKRIERLHSDANFLLNTFNYWIKQGKDINITSTFSPNDTLEITIPDPAPATSTVTTTINKAGTGIKINNSSTTAEDTEVVDLYFTKMPHSLRIHLAIQVKGFPESIFNITTTIAQRR